MRNLAELNCSICGKKFFGDLMSGHGLYYPMLLEVATGHVHDKFGVPWFADWLRESFENRSDDPVKLDVEEFKPIKRAILLNCLDTLYGHSLLKLLNAQYYLEKKHEFDLIVLVPRVLRWLVPEGVAAIWTVDIPLKEGTQWNECLANEIRKRVENWDECYLSVGFSHPHQDDFDIERFSRVTPFPFDEWETRLSKPTITFIWRPDRLWSPTPSNSLWARVKRRIHRSSRCNGKGYAAQRRKVINLAEKLRAKLSSVDFAVVGLDSPGGLPEWILDLRTTRLDAEIETSWCQRYSRSHVVVGVHGSNMLLPSAHAGAVVDLMPIDRWGNIIQDVLLRREDQRESLFRYRFLPLTASEDIVCNVVTSLCVDWGSAFLSYNRKYCDHRYVDLSTERSERWLQYLAERNVRRIHG